MARLPVTFQGILYFPLTPGRTVQRWESRWKKGDLAIVEEDERSRIGQWEPIKYRFEELPVHMALLHTGKVLAFGGSGNEPRDLRDPHPAEIFDPKTRKVYPIPQDLAGDIFCAGHSFLADGRLLVAGGTWTYPGFFFGRQVSPHTGLEQTYVFDPLTESWTRVGDMRHGRWYPTLVTLGDGRVVCMAGLTKRFPWGFLREVEIYSQGLGWSKLRRAGRWLPLYPRLHLLPDGGIFYSGSYNTHYTFPFSLRAFPTATLTLNPPGWESTGRPKEAERQEAAAVLLPFRHPKDSPRVLLVGGGTPEGKRATDKAEIIDLSEKPPVWVPVNSMKHARYYAYTVILPDAKVLVLGGHSGEPTDDDSAGTAEGNEAGEEDDEISRHPHAVRVPELFDPEDKSWRTLAPMKLDRLYHSNALLLPDGRVLVAGSNPSNEFELRIEIFHPPYLFLGPRPKIRKAPNTVSYGKGFEIQTPDSEEGNIVLIHPSSTTHCVDTDGRYVGLNVTRRGQGRLTAEIPDNRNLLPPGYYMLFVVRDGVPSKARFVRLT